MLRKTLVTCSFHHGRLGGRLPVASKIQAAGLCTSCGRAGPTGSSICFDNPPPATHTHMRGRAGRAHIGGSPRQGLTRMLMSSSGWESGTNVLCHLCQPSPPTLHQHRSLLRTAVSRASAPAVWRAWRIQCRHPRSQRQPAACLCFSCSGVTFGLTLS